MAEKLAKLEDPNNLRETWAVQPPTLAQRMSPCDYMWTIITLLVLIAAPAFAFVVCFSAMGWGDETYVKSSEFGVHVRAACFAGSLGWALIMWLFDAEYWENSFAVGFRNFTSLGASVAFCIGVILSSHEYPYGPICLYMIGLPVYLMIIYDLFLKNITNSRHYMGMLPLPLIAVALATIGLWLWWVLTDSQGMWNDENRETYSIQVECPGYRKLNNESYTGDLTVDDIVCLDAFMIWVSPVCVGASTLIYGLICLFLDDNDAHTFSPKALGAFFFLLLAVGWVASSLASAGSGVTSAFFAFAAAGLIALCFIVVGVFGVKGLEEELAKSEEIQETIASFRPYATALQGLFIVSCGPAILIYLFLSCVNQFVRQILNCCVYSCAKRLTAETRKRWLTDTVAKQWDYAMTWKWDGVLYSALIWGQAFMIMNVIVSKYVTVFLSWLNSQCGILKESQSEDIVGFILVSLVIVGVGMFLFLLPPVPGVPIYLTGGIILIKAGTDHQESATGFLGAWPAVGVTCGLCLCIKLFACTLQQKFIGGFFAGNVGVRQACGVNSSGARTMKRILKRPGLDMAKVSILVGGPDWPTSVMCGIMGLPLLPVLVGTLPVALLIIPTVLSGSFTYLGSLYTNYGTGPTDDGVRDADGWPDENDTPNWEWCGTAASLAFTLTAGVQTGSMFMAAHYLTKEVGSVDAKTKELVVKVLSGKNMMAANSIIRSDDYLEPLGFDVEADGEELVAELNTAFTDKSSTLEMPPTIIRDKNVQTVEELVALVSIELMPLDMEVVEADGMAQKMGERYAELRRWDNLSCGVKGLLIVAVILMSITMCGVNLVGGSFFTEFELTSDVKQDLPCELGGETSKLKLEGTTKTHCGSVLYFATPSGVFVLCIYLASTILLFVFNQIMGCKMSGDDTVKELRVAKKEGDLRRKALKAAQDAVSKAEKSGAPEAELNPLKDEVGRCEAAVEEQKKIVKKLINAEDEDALEAGDKPTKSAHFAEVKEQADDEKPFAVDDEKGLDGKTPEL